MSENDERKLLRLKAQLAAKYALTTSEIAVDDRAWKITAVPDQDALLDAVDDLNHFPFGLLLWESAVGLARFFSAGSVPLAGKRVLELGAGVGLPGLVAASLGASVTQTDYQQDALLLATINALQNLPSGISPHAQLPVQFLSDWRTWKHPARYDLILGADILYERSLHYHLMQIFTNNLEQNGTLLLADPGRPQAAEFVESLRKFGWTVMTTLLPVQLEGGGQDGKPTTVRLLQVNRTHHASLREGEHKILQENPVFMPN